MEADQIGGSFEVFIDDFSELEGSITNCFLKRFRPY
jgi:hypothetical protein